MLALQVGQIIFVRFFTFCALINRNTFLEKAERRWARKHVKLCIYKCVRIVIRQAATHKLFD